MIILDTCCLVFDALNPQKLSETSKKFILQAQSNNTLYCCDISLWEIAMLVQKKRLEPGTDTLTFLQLILQARQIQTLNITPNIAALATSYCILKHYDPADRIIAATTIQHRAKLITCDRQLRKTEGLATIW